MEQNKNESAGIFPTKSEWREYPFRIKTEFIFSYFFMLFFIFVIAYGIIFPAVMLPFKYFRWLFFA
jgi:hypothetical protein